MFKVEAKFQWICNRNIIPGSPHSGSLEFESAFPKTCILFGTPKRIPFLKGTRLKFQSYCRGGRPTKPNCQIGSRSKWRQSRSKRRKALVALMGSRLPARSQRGVIACCWVELQMKLIQTVDICAKCQKEYIYGFAAFGILCMMCIKPNDQSKPEMGKWDMPHFRFVDVGFTCSVGYWYSVHSLKPKLYEFRITFLNTAACVRVCVQSRSAGAVISILETHHVKRHHYVVSISGISPIWATKTLQ